MESVSEALRYIESVELPFTLDSFSELVKKMKLLLLCMIRFDDTPIDEQNKVANWLIQVHMFQKFKLFFIKVKKSYPKLFESEVGDEIVYGYSEYFAADVRDETILPLLLHTCCFLLESLINITDRFESIQKACCNDGLVQFVIKDILPLLLDIKWGEFTFKEEFLNRSLDVVYNCCKVPSNHIHYEEAKAADVLLKIREKTRQYQNEADVTSLLALGYLLDDSNNKEIMNGEGTIRQILQYIMQSLNDCEHQCSGFHLEEFLTGISHLAVSDENKDLICDEGGISTLEKVLKKSHNDKELIACCTALWLLCFSKKGASLIDENEELKTLISNLQVSKNIEVQRYASGVLWQLEHTEKKIQDSERLNGDREVDGATEKLRNSFAATEKLTNSFHGVENQHIMISYQWDNQPLAKKIADYLKERGFKVWIDIYEMKGYIMDDMATAVENASYLIICLSRRYKNSPNTRRECDYAFQLGKDFIPLMMEENYKPDGWLGILLGTKLWTDFTNEGLFEHKMKDLCSRLGNVCKTVETIISPIREPGLTAGNVNIDDPFYGQHHPIQHHDVKDSGRTEQPPHNKPDHAEMENKVLQWGNFEASAWIKSKGLAGCMKKATIKKINGLHLVMLYRLQKTQPSVYYQTAMPQIGGGDFLDVLTFGYHLEALFETIPSQ